MKQDDAITMFYLLIIAILCGSCHKPFELKVHTFNGVHAVVDVVMQT